MNHQMSHFFVNYLLCIRFLKETRILKPLSEISRKSSKISKFRTLGPRIELKVLKIGGFHQIMFFFKYFGKMTSLVKRSIILS